MQANGSSQQPTVLTEKLKKLDKGFNVAIAGATGEVGREMGKILASRNFPIDNLYCLASKNKPGRVISFKDQEIEVQSLPDFDFSKAQLVLMAMGGSLSKEYAPKIADAGCLMVDNSSAFRQDPDVPLVLAEVNAHVLEQVPARKLVANPNCSTMQLLVALNPIYKQVGIKRIFVATYQSASGAGAKGVEELRNQTTALLSGKEPKREVFTDNIAFNAIPHIDTFQENGFTREEMKIVWETHKIFNDDSIEVASTAVRIPVFYGHSEVVDIITKEPISADEVRELLANAPGVIVIDEHADGGYPTALTHAAGNDEVFVGRIRNDLHNPCGLQLWVVSDNVRKGAALNAVQIAEYLAAYHLS